MHLLSLLTIHDLTSRLRCADHREAGVTGRLMRRLEETVANLAEASGVE